MENKNDVKPVIITEEDNSPLIFTKQEKLNCYRIVFRNLIKLLYLIEDEFKGGENAHNWFTTFMLDLKSSNSLCDLTLTKVLIKMNSLYEKDAYKAMTHSQIKRQIMESRAIVEYLIAESEKNEITSDSDKK